MCTTRLPELKEHVANKHPKKTFEECFKEYDPNSAANAQSDESKKKKGNNPQKSKAAKGKKGHAAAPTTTTTTRSFVVLCFLFFLSCASCLVLPFLFSRERPRGFIRMRPINRKPTQTHHFRFLPPPTM